MSHKAHDAVILDAAVERVLAPYKDLFPPHKVDDLRRSLRFGLDNHPGAQELIARLRPRATTGSSGKQSVAGDTAEHLEEKAGSDRGRGQ